MSAPDPMLEAAIDLFEEEELDANKLAEALEPTVDHLCAACGAKSTVLWLRGCPACALESQIEDMLRETA